MESDRIRNIIFDLGGVIVGIEPNLTARAFADLSGSEPVDIMELHQSANFFTDYEKGLITDDVFRREIRNFLGQNATDDQIDQAWGALLLDIHHHKIEMLVQAKKEYRTFLLSNTNHIHQQKFSKTFRETAGSEIEEFFEKVYYSYRMGKRKPDEDIFIHVLDENNLEAGNTLLVDDSLPNIETARKLGLHTLHVARNQGKIELLTNGRD